MTKPNVPFKTLLSGQKRVSKTFSLPSLTHQSFEAECNINTILNRWQKTGIIEHTNKHEGQYGDFLDVQDYHSSVNQVLAAQEMFMTLPSSVRKRFDNDPSEFLQFVGNAKNRDEMISMGLCKPDTLSSADLDEKIASASPIKSSAEGTGDS